MRTPVEKALWFIESHFSRDLSLDEVAAVCNLSRFQMSRLFSYAVGSTVTAYVRGRRLTWAAHALANGAADILSVALEVGYGSHEAFSRAFRDQFGVTPAEVRARGHVDGLALTEPRRVDPKITVDLPPPRIETPGPLFVAGLGRRFACEDFANIPALWQEFHPYLDEMPRRKGGETYGIVANMAAGGGSYFYLAGAQVADFSALDQELTGLRLPAQRWAVFPHEGHITTITSTIGAIFAQALPAAGLVPGEMPDLIERYGPRFDPYSGYGGCEIWVPVKCSA